ncbi:MULTISPECIES: hypothetical protein [Clavibacter]|uniref:Lipoprotein n=1 Tax=Clavibacter tessellarius TaxID=31965 RepID=A0A154V1X9_9MICO|nr:hypothetical protein [Clavibacter michiganensis]KZC95383.1 hypothetical protein AWH51_08430 [Clavibacter michiganensis subsp. tessellarius]
MTWHHRLRPDAMTGACLIGLLALAGCTSGPTGEEGDPSSASTLAPAVPEATPSDAEQFSSLEASVNRKFSSWEHAGDFTGSAAELAEVPRTDTAAATIEPGSGSVVDVTLPASSDPAAKKVVMTVTCTGSENYWINVAQPNPNRVGTTCGTEGRGIYGVPLDDPTAPTKLEITIPDGSRFWLSTYYTRE